MSGLHEGQRSILRAAKRFNSVACGRRFGKTTLGVALAFHGAPHSPGGLAQGFDVGWFAPSYKLLDEAWRATKSALRSCIVRSDTQQRRLELSTGGAMDFWTLENPDGGRGRRYGLAIIDEAAMARNLEPAWDGAIRPTLTDYRGAAWFFSTPRGRNFFWALHQRGGNPERWQDWASHHAPTAANPRIDQTEIDAARQSLPERIFEQEYMARFLDDGGGVFRHVMDAVRDDLRPIPERGHRYVMGVDLGRKVDFTAIVVLDISVDPRAVVAVDRFNQISWEFQVGRIKAIAERFAVEHIMVDQTGVGDPIVQQLQRELSR